MKKLPRRDFLQCSTMLVGGMMLSPLIPHPNHVSDHQNNTGDLLWYQRPLRIMHTVLREIDAKNYNADAVIAYRKKGNYNTLCVNAGGIVDFFQNPLPAANINRIMGNRDILKEISTACRNAGIKVIARVDFRGVEEHVFNKLPDWFMRDADQHPVKTDYTKP